MQSPSFTRSLLKNSAHACDLRSCGRPRTGLNRWCVDHLRHAQRYGHPQGRPLRPNLWAVERGLVANLLAKNANHPGQLQALEWVRGLLAQAASNEGAYRGAEELARLSRHGVTALGILTELCAVSLYLGSNPRAVPDDRSWDFAVSSAVFQLAPRPRRITRRPGGAWPVSGKVDPRRTYAPKPRTSALAHVGLLLRQALAPFLANVQTAIESRDAQRIAFEAALTAPLSAL